MPHAHRVLPALPPTPYAQEEICNVLELSDDVAGATFMAAGSSAPELASSAMSLLNPNAGSEIGVGTIVGSAIFNILVIIGVTVVSTGNTLQLDWKPVTRDCAFYAAAIAGIVGTFQDGKTEWWEGAVYVACYGLYILTMKNNVALMEWMDKMGGGDGSNIKKGSSFDKGKSMEKNSAAAIKMAEEEAAADDADTATAAAERKGGAGTFLAAAAAAAAETTTGDEKVSVSLAVDVERVAVTIDASPSRPSAPTTKKTSSGKQLWAALKDKSNIPDVVPKKQSIADIVLAVQASHKWKAKRRSIGEHPEGDAGTHVLTPTLSSGHIRAYRTEAIRAASLLKRREEAAAKKAEALEAGTGGDAADGDGGDDDDEGGSPFALPDDPKDYPMWALSLPWYAVFTITIPPCAEEKWQKWYIVSFLMSIAWIGFITHWMVEWCVRIGCILNIPAVVMGTTVLAAGTSIPDALSSISVAKDGLADMAVANAVGSNVFDIWLGLGLPWLCYLSWQKPDYILVNTTELVPSSLILAGVLVLYYGTIATNGFKLTVRMGYIYMATYVLYALYSIVLVWLLDVYKLQK